MKLRSLLACAVLVPAAFMLGCASASTPAPDEAAGGAPGASTVTVVNNHTSNREMIIYLEPQGRGERQTLGTVAPGQTTTFSHSIDTGYYELTAAHDLGELDSTRFNVQGPSEVRWVLNTNRVTVGSR
jgi:hypothetical protein